MTNKEAIKNLVAYAYFVDEIPEEVAKSLDMAIEALKEQRPHGEWKKTTHAIVCSNCGHNIEHRLFGAYMRYCCVCGSDNAERR